MKTKIDTRRTQVFAIILVALIILASFIVVVQAHVADPVEIIKSNTIIRDILIAFFKFLAWISGSIASFLIIPCMNGNNIVACIGAIVFYVATKVLEIIIEVLSGETLDFSELGSLDQILPEQFTSDCGCGI